jgi:N-acetylglucosaminyldiphosphoundecaprenol N-acetyl-beta-D-mannosaminyltransferase
MTAISSPAVLRKESPFEMLGIRVYALQMLDLNNLVAKAIAQNKRWVIAHHNLHSVYIYHRDETMREYFAQTDYTHIDGMYLVFLGKLLGLPLGLEHRTGYVDWMHPLMSEAAEKGWRVFYLGSKPGVAERSAQKLREQYPNLQIATAHGYFDINSDSAENQDILATINAYQPNLLMVGMGMPRQERWVLENRQHLSANAIVPCGAMMDYVAGEIPTPPRWTGRLGVEWLYRLLSEPKRLWFRYLVEPWFVLKVFLPEYRDYLLSLFGFSQSDEIRISDEKL